MLRLLLTKFKNLLLLLLIGTMVFTTINTAHAEDYFTYRVENDYIEITVDSMQQQYRQCDVIVRAGEYYGKPGKRIYVNNATVTIPDDIPIRNDYDGKGFYVHENDINIKESKALVAKLRAMGINAQLQIASDKSQDLNAAGRLANQSNPYLYLSIHHNSYESNSTGYFGMYNPNDKQGQEIANRLTNAIRDNNQIPQRTNRENTGYIGEMNTINSTTTPVLLELGFFSNIDELEIICSNSYVDYVSTNLANEIRDILNENYN